MKQDEENKDDISALARTLGKRGGEKTKQRGREYYKRIGQLRLAKRYRWNKRKGKKVLD